MSNKIELDEALKKFFSTSLATSALKKLKNNSVIAFQMKNSSTAPCYLIKKNNDIVFTHETKSPQQVTLSIPIDSLNELASQSFKTHSEIGIAIASKILSQDPLKKIEIKIECSLLRLVSQGYFSLLLLGGNDFFAFLSKRGIKGIRHIKKAIRK